jgi:glycosyltransferase involved in cell wall biosynthesis
VKILVVPREDSNPYQRLLYGELAQLGVRARYLGCLTPSHTLNLLLLPAELGYCRLTGWRAVHLHWVFGFALTGSGRFRVFRWLSQAWFAMILRCIRLLRMPLVWTVHNVMPHAPVFADDVAARRRLVAACALVIAHTDAALVELAALGLSPGRAVVIPHGPFLPSRPASSLREPGQDGVRQILFFGKVQAYKGAETLVRAFLARPAGGRAHLTIVGECTDPEVRSALTELARNGGGEISLRLERVPESEVTSLLEAADVVALPFERVTTSGSVMLAMCHGRPVIVPAIPALAGLPDDAVFRYDCTLPDLTATLAEATALEAGQLAKMSAAAFAYAATHSWADIAAETSAQIVRVLA